MQLTCLQRDEKIFLRIFSLTKIHKVDYSIYRNKSNFIVKHEEGKHSRVKQLMNLYMRPYYIWVYGWLQELHNNLWQAKTVKVLKCCKRYAMVLFISYSFSSLRDPIINFSKASLLLIALIEGENNHDEMNWVMNRISSTVFKSIVFTKIPLQFS